MNNTITAQELKVKGALAIKKIIGKFQEAIITVRGKESFVVLSFEQYKLLRERELQAAIDESKQAIFEKKYKIKSVKGHVKELSDV